MIWIRDELKEMSMRRDDMSDVKIEQCYHKMKNHKSITIPECEIEMNLRETKWNKKWFSKLRYKIKADDYDVEEDKIKKPEFKDVFLVDYLGSTFVLRKMKVKDTKGRRRYKIVDCYDNNDSSQK